MHRRQFLGTGAAAMLLPHVAAAQAPAAGSGGWTKLATVPFAGKQDDIAFASWDSGWYGNGEGRLYRTGDGGDSWTQAWHQPGTFIRALGFIDERTGILGNVGTGVYPGVSDSVPLYRSDDGGASWQPARIDGPTPGGICAIDIRRGRRGPPVLHAAGRVGGPAFYLQSRDRGRSWRSMDLAAQAMAIFDVKFISARTGFLAAASGPDQARMRGLILRSDDGGASWQEAFRSARPYETVWKLHFPSDQVGYGSIQSYDPDAGVTRRHIAKSTDGGRTWSELPLIDERRWRSFGIGFADERRGWVGGSTGGLETRDGGQSWTPVAIGRAVNKIRFVEDGRRRRVFAIGSDVYRLDLS